MTSRPFLLPFLVFLGFMGLFSAANLSPLAEQALWFLAMAATIALLARPALNFRVSSPASSVALGIAVFFLWIGPDVLWPGYRGHWLFSNSITGAVSEGLAADARTPPVLIFRALRAAVIVPIVEELFWRAWLMRWVIHPDFSSLPLGAYSPKAFWIVAILFAAEHGPFWDVGLACGILYNWWMVRTRSLGDLILTHAVTNACLSAYVIAAGKWEYW